MYFLLKTIDFIFGVNNRNFDNFFEDQNLFCNFIILKCILNLLQFSSYSTLRNSQYKKIRFYVSNMIFVFQRTKAQEALGQYIN